MNFDDAVAAHIKWKVRLGHFIHGMGSEKFDSDEVAKDDVCALGRWIYAEGARWSGLPAYRDLVDKHARFHRLASEIVKKVESGDKAGAALALGGPFAGASRETVAAIRELQRQAEGRPAPAAHCA